MDAVKFLPFLLIVFILGVNGHEAIFNPCAYKQALVCHANHRPMQTKFLGFRLAYYTKSTSTFQIKLLLVSGAINPNPGPGHNDDSCRVYNCSYTTNYTPIDRVNSPSVYGRHELLQLNSLALHKQRLDVTLWETLTSLGIAKKRRCHRSKKAGARKQRHRIPVTTRSFSTTTPRVMIHKRRDIRLTNPNDHERPPSSAHVISLDDAALNEPTRIAVWNAQSMMNKPDSICDFVMSESLDILAITEAWLRGDDRDSPTLAQIQNTLRGYHILTSPRKGKVGGSICVVLRQNFGTNMVIHSYTSFECTELTLHSTRSNVLSLIIIYRPPGSMGRSAAQFLSDFSRLLESASLRDNQLAICGDFNFHMDNVHSSETKSLTDLLFSANLKQLVSQPTHARGHTLDLVITREANECIKELYLRDAMPSDHSAIVFTVALSRPMPVRKTFCFRKLRDIDYDIFRSDLESLFAASEDLDYLDIDQKVNLYNSSLMKTLNHHAPVKFASVQLRPQAPWFYHHLITLRRKVRSAERKWRKTHLTVDKMSMRSALCVYQSALKMARNYHREKVENCCQKELFQFVNSISSGNNTSPLPSHSSKQELAELFLSSFQAKVSKVCHSLVLTTSEVHSASLNDSAEAPQEFMLKKLHAVSQSDVKKIITTSKIKTSQLDPLPASVAGKCVDFLIPAITDITNHLLASGIFPHDLKTALVTYLKEA
ncbi:uncharacterized protein [Diadema antillarum]|uniref:uncharacterized protein n=1 Tax=Diadema antillarum TaxID=105358 RepID=UPI003A88F4F4